MKSWRPEGNSEKVHCPPVFHSVKKLFMNRGIKTCSDVFIQMKENYENFLTSKPAIRE